MDQWVSVILSSIVGTFCPSIFGDFWSAFLRTDRSVMGTPVDCYSLLDTFLKSCNQKTKTKNHNCSTYWGVAVVLAYFRSTVVENISIHSFPFTSFRRFPIAIEFLASGRTSRSKADENSLHTFYRRRDDHWFVIFMDAAFWIFFRSIIGAAIMTSFQLELHRFHSNTGFCSLRFYGAFCIKTIIKCPIIADRKMDDDSSNVQGGKAKKTAGWNLFDNFTVGSKTAFFVENNTNSTRSTDYDNNLCILASLMPKWQPSVPKKITENSFKNYQLNIR